ncbi:P22 phage major capsid protein family protein [Pseudoalteromonas sp.]|uniref:P22 phage major capsid protein family protein n=1 Tax=Pseudoalteromonas sp. TaxID=53249 RepID=UPI00261FB2AE|nr:P22 phage major capsid protein family protein [Pseudoalteromonas sp.]MCP4585904.1 P22 coat protein [Pseudoalteromonas sp.]
MANTYLDVSTIAAEALPLLADQMAMLPLVHRGFDNEFGSPKQKGDTIQIEKPQNFTTVDGSVDISGSYQDITETAVNLQLNVQRSVAIEITAKDLTLSVPDFTRKFTAGAVVALGEYVNQDILGLYTDIPYWYGVSGTTPDALEDIALARKVLQDNKCPSNLRSLVMDNSAEAEFLTLDALVKVNEAGTNRALREAAIGQVYKIGMYSDGQVKTHTAGGYAALTDLTSDGIQTIGATTFNVASTAGASTASVVVGDIFTIETGAAAGQYVCTAAATAVAGDIALTIYPALRGATATIDTVAFADETAGAHVANLMFQKNAFALGMAPLAAPVGGANGSVMTANGMSISVTLDFDITTYKNIMRFDILYGVKTLYPELACRLLG